MRQTQSEQLLTLTSLAFACFLAIPFKATWAQGLATQFRNQHYSQLPAVPNRLGAMGCKKHWMLSFSVAAECCAYPHIIQRNQFVIPAEDTCDCYNRSLSPTSGESTTSEAVPLHTSADRVAWEQNKSDISDMRLRTCMNIFFVFLQLSVSLSLQLNKLYTKNHSAQEHCFCIIPLSPFR